MNDLHNLPVLMQILVVAWLKKRMIRRRFRVRGSYLSLSFGGFHRKRLRMLCDEHIAEIEAALAAFPEWETVRIKIEDAETDVLMQARMRGGETYPFATQKAGEWCYHSPAFNPTPGATRNLLRFYVAPHQNTRSVYVKRTNCKMARLLRRAAVLHAPRCRLL